jgi:cell division protein FtsQ
VHRARGRRRRRRIAIAVLAVTGLAVAVVVLALSGLASVRHVTVRGSVHTPDVVVVDAAGLAGAPPLVEVDPGKVAARLERLPWVARAVVARHWPDAVTITVVERVPVAVAARRGGVALLDATGRVLAWPSAAPPGLPELHVSSPVGAPGTSVGALAREASAVAGALPRALSGHVVGVSVAGGDTVTLDLGGGVSAILGPPTLLGAKFESLASVLAGVPLHVPAVVDVTVPEEPTVGPPPAPARSS